MSFHPVEASGPRSACVTNEPSGSWRSSSPSGPETTISRPSGSQSKQNANAVGTWAMTALFPSASTATISCVPQLPNHRRPSCQRGDSPIARPVSRMSVIGTPLVFRRLLRAPLSADTNAPTPDRQPAKKIFGPCISRAFSCVYKRTEGGFVGFDEFVADRLDGLLRYATVLTDDPHLAQDIVQDVLLRAQQRWTKIEAPATYVRRMVTNEYLSWRRRAVRRMIPSSHEMLDALGPATADPATAYDERDAMLARLATLPRKQRAAIVLRYYENYTDDEIAAVLRCGASTVRSQISRALATLRAAAAPRPVLTTGAPE